MYIYFSPSTNCHENLALEEYLLKNSTTELLLIYRNQPCIVVGKHQNINKEVNTPFMINHSILPSRRLSGGGTVYHDENNINLSFILSADSADQIGYENRISILVSFLKSLQVISELNARKDLTIDGKKISGSAMHIHKGRSIAHCTLLFDSNLSNLRECLKSNQDRYQDKSIPSVRSSVTTIRQHLHEKIDTEQFLSKLIDFLVASSDYQLGYEITEIQKESISNLVTTKYSTIEWIYGYSPSYRFHNSIIDKNNHQIFFEISVVKGIIKEIITNPSENRFSQRLNQLLGMHHHPESIRDLQRILDDEGIIPLSLINELF